MSTRSSSATTSSGSFDDSDAASPPFRSPSAHARARRSSVKALTSSSSSWIQQSREDQTAVAMASDYSMSSEDEDFDNQQPAGETIRVTVRFRPLLSREKASGSSAWSVHPQTNTIAPVASSPSSSSTGPDGAPLSSRSNSSRRGGNSSAFAFDEVYQEHHSTQAIYDGLAQSIARSALDGIHGSLFAYGQTSSGKTFTMQGSSKGAKLDDGDETEDDRRPLPTDGIIQLAVKDIFDEMAKRQRAAEFVVRVSYIEIYNETVRDLLSSSAGTISAGCAVLNVREHPVHGVFTDATEREVSDARGVLQALRDGEKSRAVGATNMNERSSRSHTIFRVSIESRAALSASSSGRGKASQASGECVRVGCLNFVDLAGSESSQRTGAQGKRLTEAGNINRSLLALSRVIHALSSSSRKADANAQHISFRDSKLTRILQPSLSGGARVLFICCVSPSQQFAEDTKSTLKFATRAKRIQIHASVNEVTVLDDGDTLVKVRSLEQENEALRRDLEKLRDAQEVAASLKKQIQMMEMEMLIRGGESRESLTGLLSSLELRESFRSSDCTSAFMLGENDEDEDGYNSAYDSEGERVEPEEERESFFVEDFIDPNEMTDEEEDYDEENHGSESPETVVEPDHCLHCDELEQQLLKEKEQLALHAQVKSRLEDLQEAQQRVQQLEVDCVALQKLALETETASKDKISALEDELAHVSKLSQHQKQLLDALQQQQQLQEPSDEEERLLLAESGGVLGEDRQHGHRVRPVRWLFFPGSIGWGRAESTTLLMALVLICVTLYCFSGALASAMRG